MLTPEEMEELENEIQQSFDEYIKSPEGIQLLKRFEAIEEGDAVPGLAESLGMSLEEFGDDDTWIRKAAEIFGPKDFAEFIETFYPFEPIGIGYLQEVIRLAKQSENLDQQISKKKPT